jgi:hypothetical protein
MDEWKKTAEEVAGGGKQAFSDVRDMKFKDNSKYNIRILPKKNDKAVPFISYVIHWIPQINSVKGKPIIHNRGEKCPVDYYIADLWTEINRLKEEEDLQDSHPKIVAIKSKISAVKASEKFDFNILDRDDLMHVINGKKVLAVKRMTVPSTIWKPIFELANNPKWGNPSEKDTGYDLDITTEGEQERRKYTILGDKNSSPLTKDEIEALNKTAYDLDKLRNKTSKKDMIEIIQNAKPPYDEIATYLDKISDDDDDNDKPTQRKQTKQEEPEVEEQKSTKQEDEPAVEEKNEEDTSNQNTENAEPEQSTQSPDNSEDPNNINSYECKGEFDSGEELCLGCPVKDDCIVFQPIYKKAVTWNKNNSNDKIDISSAKSVSQIADLVNKKIPDIQPEQTTPKLGKKKRDIPF